MRAAEGPLAQEPGAEPVVEPYWSLAEIAVSLGYSGPTAFIRAFKQARGQTPARWRRGL